MYSNSRHLSLCLEQDTAVFLHRMCAAGAFGSLWQLQVVQNHKR